MKIRNTEMTVGLEPSERGRRPGPGHGKEHEMLQKY